MMVITEADLRARRLEKMEFHVPEGAFVTPLAREYLRDRGIRLLRDTSPFQPMSRDSGRTSVPGKYVDAETGESYEEKPEHMTHLRGNRLVPKSHPRIAFRGKLDGLQARILLLQADAEQEGLRRDLGDLLTYVQEILGAEVKEIPMGEWKLFGMDSRSVREMSHHVQTEFGFEHPIPAYTMGRTALELNLLRTEVREAELFAVQAFDCENSLGIIEAMNRMSSGVYIVFCRVLAGYYDKTGGA